MKLRSSEAMKDIDEAMSNLIQIQGFLHDLDEAGVEQLNDHELDVGNRHVDLYAMLGNARSFDVHAQNGKLQVRVTRNPGHGRAPSSWPCELEVKQLVRPQAAERDHLTSDLAWKQTVQDVLRLSQLPIPEHLQKAKEP